VFAEAAAARGDELVEWVPGEEPLPAGRFEATLVFGGAMNVHEEEANPWLVEEKALLRKLLATEVPVLGVCLGAQLVADAAGGRVGRASEPEIGWHEVERSDTRDPVIGPLPERFLAFQWHSFEFELPPGATALARSPVCLQAFRAGERTWGIQFHAEVSRTEVNAWLDDYEKDPDAVRIGLDPDALRAESEARLGGWNELGRGLCDRFLEAAATAG
jgi:GMP synthase-like glutamine amidotransferase